LIKRELFVKTGGLIVAEGQKTLYTGGVGSCVVACLWDMKKFIGGMAHIPQSVSTGDDPGISALPAVSPDRALPLLLLMMENRGAARKNIFVRLAGAGNMFRMPDDCFMCNIGRSILDKTRNVVSGLELAITGESVGGVYGRNVRFHVDTGEVLVTFTSGERLNL